MAGRERYAHVGRIASALRPRSIGTVDPSQLALDQRVVTLARRVFDDFIRASAQAVKRCRLVARAGFRPVSRRLGTPRLVGRRARHEHRFHRRAVGAEVVHLGAGVSYVVLVGGARSHVDHHVAALGIVGVDDVEDVTCACLPAHRGMSGGRFWLAHAMRNDARPALPEYLELRAGRRCGSDRPQHSTLPLPRRAIGEQIAYDRSMFQGKSIPTRPRPPSVTAWLDVCCVALALISIAACFSSTPVRGAALYPSSGAPLEPSQIATLHGYVADVDGQDVTQLVPPFELLPGCHVVHTPERWTGVNSGTVSAVAQTGRLTFALPTRAGYFYEVEVRAQVQTSISGKIDILAVESDASGQQTRVFDALKNQAELDACRAEGAGTTGN